MQVAGKHIGIINAATLLSSIDRLDELNVYFFMTRRSAACHEQHYLPRDPNVDNRPFQRTLEGGEPPAELCASWIKHLRRRAFLNGKEMTTTIALTFQKRRSELGHDTVAENSRKGSSFFFFFLFLSLSITARYFVETQRKREVGRHRVWPTQEARAP